MSMYEYKANSQPPSSRSSSHSRDQSATSYISYPVSHVVSGLYRRLTEPSPQPSSQSRPIQFSEQPNSDVYTPPHRTASPYQPPPLASLNLHSTISPSEQILTRALAEEVRLLVPPQFQLVDTWSLTYSLVRDGSSLGTLYNRCASHRESREGGVLVIKDAAGSIFGAYITDAPHPRTSFYGTGECFLWRSSILPTSSLLSSLPPPPSSDTTSLGRSTTILSPPSTSRPHPPSDSSLLSTNHPTTSGYRSGTSTPERIRFKAFPYSGVNDYLIFCEQGYFSLGGGDGRYGLWLDGVLERGISSACLTFGNEGLSEEGEKFGIVGVEVWWVGGAREDEC